MALHQFPICQKIKHFNFEKKIICHSGGTDKLLMERLEEVPNIRAYLNITNYSNGNDNYFTLKLENIETKQEALFEINVGHYVKNSRILNLKELRELICG